MILSSLKAFIFSHTIKWFKNYIYNSFDFDHTTMKLILKCG